MPILIFAGSNFHVINTRINVAKYAKIRPPRKKGLYSIQQFLQFWIYAERLVTGQKLSLVVDLFYGIAQAKKKPVKWHKLKKREMFSSRGNSKSKLWWFVTPVFIDLRPRVGTWVGRTYAWWAERLVTSRPANPWWEESGSFPFKIRDFGHQSGSFTVKRILYKKNDIHEIFSHYITLFS